MVIPAPEWLTRHGGELRPGLGGSWFVCFDGGPQYGVTPVPAEGRHTCKVLQTNSGRRLDSGASYATDAEAVRGGLEDLRRALGW